MINTVDKLNDKISACTKCLEDKITGADGKRHIVLCGGTGCLSNNSAEIRERFEQVLAEKGLTEKATVNQVGCFGFCSQGPFVKIYPEDTLYRLVQIEDVEEIVESDIQNGVVTFYSFFSLTPKGRFVIGCCLGTACYVKGAQQVIDKFSEELGIKPGQTTDDGMYTLDALRCIGACGIAPAVSINGKVYPKMTVSQVREIIAQQYLIVEKEKQAMGGVTA